MTFYNALQIFNIQNLPSSLKDLKNIYKKLAKKYHPDICKNLNCKENFQKLQEAYEILLKNFYSNNINLNNIDNNNIYINLTIKELLEKETITIQDNIINLNNFKKELKLNNKNIIINIKEEYGFYIDNKNRIIKNITLPYFYFIIGGEIIIDLLIKKIKITINNNIKPNELLKIKLNNKNIYLKLNLKLNTNNKKEIEYIKTIKNLYKNKIY